MKRLLNIVFVCCISLFCAVSTWAQDSGYGLEFNSYDAVQEKRTGLNLSPAKDFSFPDGFSLSFDLFFQSAPEYNFGYVFRIIGQDNQHLDFLANLDKLTVVNSEDKVLAEASITESGNNFSSFFPFRIQLDVKNDRLTISIGEKTFSPEVSSLKHFKKASIIFGKCDHPLLQTSDVPRMILKDVRINDAKDAAVYYWKLSTHTENGVYDELKNCFAKAENPEWLLDAHTFWNKRFSFTTLKNPQITYNPDENVIAVADRKSFFLYNTLTGILYRNNNSSGSVHSDHPNQMIYSPLDSIYYSYRFSKTDGSEVAAYNFANNSWNNTVLELDNEYWHHNRYISPQEDCLYLFGGYGQHQYVSEVNKYSFQTGKWEKQPYKGNRIDPRYLSGLGVLDENRLLLFGGYGSNTGQQFLSPKNYYDLYQINLPDLTVRKIWEMKSPKDLFVVGNSMVVDTLNQCFYALCFPQNQYETSFFLAKFSLLKPEYEIVSDSIPFYFNDILSYADLFQNRQTNELYAVTFSSHTTDSLAIVSVYSLSYPPLPPPRETFEYPNLAKSPYFYFLLAGFILLLLTAAFFGYRLRSRKKPATPTEAAIETVVKPETEELKEFSEEELNIEKPVGNRNKKQAIFLFGGFQIKDKNGDDITGEFSPMLKQLFLIILLHTLKEDGKGISSIELNETLWPNKSPDSARNNRSVMLTRLRQLFENVGVLNIESLNSYWVVKLGDEIYCDYQKALALIANMKHKNNRTKEEVMKLLSIVSFGELLPNVQVEWIDPFKSNFANQLIDLLVEVAQQDESAFSSLELVNLADTLLNFDILNDDALKLKCRALVRMGKNGLARAAYNSFAKQYAVLFGTEYNLSFNQVIS
ncbi:MAG: hypothetical protein LBE91_20050 [Tannerella sp.]|jgi:two-component SAPR family response regulator|nr:hypothetical protein [Tannerella sp.]